MSQVLVRVGKPSLKLHAPMSLILEHGKKASIPVQVEHELLQGTVVIRLKGLPQ
jgi:hypothetical protein